MGGIGMLGGTLSITRSTFINNVANNTLNPGRATGGAIATYETTVTITDFHDSPQFTTGLTGGGWAGAASGGGIDLEGSRSGDTVVISNTTVSGNEAIGATGTFQNGPGGGGAMMVSGQGTLLLQNTTIFGNYTNGGTGLYAGSAGLFISAPASAPTVQLANTVIAGNILPIGPDVKGDFTSLGYNG